MPYKYFKCNMFKTECIIFPARTFLPTYLILVHEATIIHPVSGTTNLCLPQFLSCTHLSHPVNPDSKNAVQIQLLPSALAIFHMDYCTAPVLNSFLSVLPAEAHLSVMPQTFSMVR